MIWTALAIKPVAESVHGDDKSRTLWVVLDFLPKPENVYIHGSRQRGSL